jgi:DNA-binding MarR family transcriptional regulator
MPMRNDILEKVSIDLLSIPPLIFRATRKKITEIPFSQADINITPHHLEIMKLLEEEGTLHVSQIGERLHIPKAQMTKLIDRLVTLNIVGKKLGTDDRRTYQITLRKQARTDFKEFKYKMMVTIKEIMSSFTDENLENLSVSLRNLRDVLLKSIENDSKNSTTTRD